MHRIQSEKNIKDGELPHNDYSTQLVDLPNEILTHILSFVSLDELSTNVSTTCQRLFDVCSMMLNGRITLEDENTVNDELRRMLSLNEISSSITYVILQLPSALFVPFECKYEWLEETGNLLPGKF